MSTQNLSACPQMSAMTHATDPLEDFRLVINGVFTTLIIAFGLLGNTMSIIVLQSKQMHQVSTNHFLTALAVWDFMVLFCTLFLICLPTIATTPDYMGRIFPYVVPYLYPLALTAQTSTIWLVVSLTLERYVAVCYPMKALKVCTVKRARVVIVAVTCACALYNASRWLEYETRQCIIETIDTQGRNITRVEALLSLTDLGHSSLYKRVYFLWLYLIMMCITPLCALGLLNAFLIRSVQRSRKQRKIMTQQETEHRSSRGALGTRKHREKDNITLMLIVVVLVFMCCQTPALVYNIVYAITDEETMATSTSHRLLSEVRNFMVVLNSGINCIIYCAIGKKFRQTFQLLFCRVCLSQENISQIRRVPTCSMQVHTENHRVSRMYKTTQQPQGTAEEGKPNPKYNNPLMRASKVENNTVRRIDAAPNEITEL